MNEQAQNLEGEVKKSSLEELIKTIENFEYVDDEDTSAYKFNVKGHEIVVGDKLNPMKTFGTIDGKKLSYEDRSAIEKKFKPYFEYMEKQKKEKEKSDINDIEKAEIKEQQELSETNREIVDEVLTE